MQQVAAQKTDIAALPFAASDTAKAVRTEIGMQQDANSSNNEAFNRLYQDAKSSKPDFVLNEKESMGSQSRVASRSGGTSAASQASIEMMKNGKDRDAGHTDLPVEKNVTDIPADSEAATKQVNAPVGSSEIAVDTESAKAQRTTDDEENGYLAVDGTQGSVEQISVIDAQFIVGEGGKKDAEAGVITTPGTPDGKPNKEEGEPDWVAYVETVANRFGNSEQSENASNTKTNNEISAAVDEAVNVLSVKESGKLWKLPDDVNISDAPSIMAHLLSQLNNGSSDGEISIESLTTEAKQTLSALTSLLIGADAKSEQGGGNGEANNALIHAFANAKSDMNSDDDKGLTALIAQLMQQKESAGDGVQDSSGEAEGASKLDRVLTGGKNSVDESLVLSLLSDELKEMQEMSSDEASSQAEALLAELTAATVSVKTEGVSANATNANNATSSDVGLNANEIGAQGQLANGELVEAMPKDLLTAISELSPQSAQKATEAFAERVVAGMPSGSQQQSVKANIIAGINEFQQQVQQGREPGIDLSAIIADAAKEAAVSNDVIASMTARVDSQATQFLNLMNQTQASAQQAFASMLGQTDTVMHENNQLRAEASKSQQQFEGFDKAVNIHKPEGQQQLNEKIRWMVNARNTMAEIRLDPPELGSMQVRVNVSGDAASVSFIVQSQQAKEALAEAMPKLRDMLSEQGIELGDAQVRKDNSSGNENGQQLADNRNDRRSDGNRHGNDELDEIENRRVIEQSVTRAAKGGIDFYA